MLSAILSPAMARAYKRPRTSGVGTGSSYWKPKTHESLMMTTVYEMLRGNQCCDVTLSVQGRHFPCHKAVLASASTFFKAMFTNGMAESRQDVVTLKDIDAEIFSLILDFFYTGEILFNKDNVVDILRSALFFDVEAVRVACIHFCVDNVDNENWYEVHKLKDVVACVSFEWYPISHAVRNFGDIVTLPSFLDVDVDTVLSLVSETGITVKSEDHVFEAVRKWYDHCPETRLGDLERLLEEVRFPLMSADYLCNVVDAFSNQVNLPRLRELVNEAKMCHLLPQKLVDITAEESNRGTKRNPGSYDDHTLGIARNMAKVDDSGTHFYPKHAKEMLSSLNKMLESETLCDVKVVTPQQQFLCHKVVLGALSPYFKEECAKMKKVTPKATRGKAAKPDTQTITLTVKNVETEIFKLILKYAYTGEIEITTENIKPLVACSSSQLFDIQSIQEACCDFIGTNVTIDNCLDNISLYEELGFQDSADIAFQFAGKNFEEIFDIDMIEEPDFGVTINGDTLLKIITAGELKVSKEEVLCNTVMTWYNVFPETRGVDLEKMLGYIRFPLLPAEYLCRDVEAFAKKVNSPKLRELLEEAKLCHLLPEKRKELLDAGSVRITPRTNYVSFGSEIEYHRAEASFSFKLLNVSKLGPAFQESPICEIRNLLWSMKVRSKEITHGNHRLSVYILFRPKSRNSKETTCYASISVTLKNNRDLGRTRELCRSSCSANKLYGWSSFIGSKGLLDHKKGFRDVNNDSITFKVNIAVDGGGSEYKYLPPSPVYKCPVDNKGEDLSDIDNSPELD